MELLISIGLGRGTWWVLKSFGGSGRVRLKETKQHREEKSHFFFLSGFVWLLRNELCEGKMKGKNRKSDF